MQQPEDMYPQIHGISLVTGLAGRHKSVVNRKPRKWRTACRKSALLVPLDEPRAHHPILPFLFFWYSAEKKPYRIDDNYRCGRKPIKITIKPSIDQNRKKCQIKKLAIQKLPGHRLFHSREREREGMRMRNPRGIEDPRRGNEEKAAIWNLTETFVKWLGRRRMIDEDATSLDRAATWKNDGAALPRNPIKPRANQRRDI